MCIYNFPDSILSVIFGLAKYFIYLFYTIKDKLFF